MLNTRSLVIGMIIVAVLYVAALVMTSVQPPDSAGYGRDSFGTQAHGYGALFETLEKLRIPVERSLLPPVGLSDRTTTLVLLAPSLPLMKRETTYIQDVVRWVRAGGRVLLAPANYARQPDLEEKYPMLDVFGLAGVEREELNPAEMAVAGLRAPTTQVPGESSALTRWLRWLGFERQPLETLVLPVKTDGKLTPLDRTVQQISVPARKLWVLDFERTSDPAPSGRLFFTAGEGQKTLVAEYTHGKGQIVVVSDPILLSNGFLYRSDNAVLAVHLLAPTDGPVVFDEFYHGLVARGNPFSLLLRYPYGLLLLLVTITASLWAWREAVSLGPPGRQPHEARTLREYVDAMARLFEGGRDSQRFMLTELRSGVLWMLARRYRHRRPELSELLSLIERHDPERARRLQRAVADVDALLTDNSSGNAVTASRMLIRCL